MIDPQFRGPSSSGNGGYVCGRLAAWVDAPGVEVTLRRPPPLERPLSVVADREGARLLDDGELVAEAGAAAVSLAPPRTVSIGQGRTAEAGYLGDLNHSFPECFVCGPARAAGDGLRLRPGPVPGEPLVATTWHPDDSLAAGDGRVRPEFVWAALDCPGAFAVESQSGRGTRVLGRLAVRIDERPRVGAGHVVVGWPLGGEGRKREAGTALFDDVGALLAVGRAVWIELRP